MTPLISKIHDTVTSRSSSVSSKSAPTRSTVMCWLSMLTLIFFSTTLIIYMELPVASGDDTLSVIVHELHREMVDSEELPSELLPVTRQQIRANGWDTLHRPKWTENEALWR